MKRITNLKTSLIMSVFLLAMVSTAMGEIIFVDADATGNNDGSSWGDAYNYLQDALAVAQCGNEIWVAEGIYRPDEDTDHPSGTDDRTATFQLVNGVAIYGGFAGGETSLNERDWETHETILSGDLNGDDVGFTNNGENSYHVVMSSGRTDPNSVLDGFTITAGNANGSWPNGVGGGMWNYNEVPTTGPTLSNCRFYRNCAQDGGGLYNYYNSSTVTNCMFVENLTCDGTGSGAGIYNAYNSSTFINCGFYRNVNTGGGGGGMCNFRCSSTFTNCVFVQNSAENSTYGCGGGMYNRLDGTSLTLTNCVFSGNAAYKSGGGIHNEDDVSITLTNCIFSGNSSAMYGGGIHNNKSVPTLTNCTFGRTVISVIPIAINS